MAHRVKSAFLSVSTQPCIVCVCRLACVYGVFSPFKGWAILPSPADSFHLCGAYMTLLLAPQDDKKSSWSHEEDKSE